MMKFLFALAFLCSLSLSARADEIEDAVKADFSGWDIYKQAAGDLNGDGQADAAVIMFKRSEKEEDAGGAAVLAVYLKQDGKLKLHTQSEGAICVGCGGPKAIFNEPLGELKITDKGLLTIYIMGGSRDMYEDTQKWRLDKKAGKFLLIGETQVVTDTLGEEPTQTIDVNYLTMKMDKITGKKKHSCPVPKELSAQELSVFEYADKHEDDLGKLNEACK